MMRLVGLLFYKQFSSYDGYLEKKMSKVIT